MKIILSLQVCCAHKPLLLELYLNLFSNAMLLNNWRIIKRLLVMHERKCSRELMMGG